MMQRMVDKMVGLRLSDEDKESLELIKKVKGLSTADVIRLSIRELARTVDKGVDR